VKPTLAHLCTSCQARWRQSKLGLCRTCENDQRNRVSTIERDAARLEAQRQRLAALERREGAEHRPLRTRVIDGVAYDVTWDGTV
jgi:hypothetical protein